VTSNQAVLWDALVQVGADRGAGPGRLFEVAAAAARVALRA
jgi:hypothetical protein